MGRTFGRNVKLPTLLAHVTYSLSFSLDTSNAHCLRSAEWEVLIWQFIHSIGSNSSQKLFGIRPLDTNHRVCTCYISKGDKFVFCGTLLEEIHISRSLGCGTNDKKGILVYPSDSEVWLKTSFVIEHARVNHFTIFNCDVVATNSLQELFGISALNNEFSETTHVKQGNFRSCVQMLSFNVFQPSRLFKSMLFVVRQVSYVSEVVGSFPPKFLTKYSPIIGKSFK